MKNDLKPKILKTMKTYSKEQFVKDLIAGIIVAIVALPLSIALAIASGVNPERGLYTAIIAGFFISFLGGSRVQIGGPTAAFVVIIYGIVANPEYGVEGLIVATIMGGIMLVLMGVLRLGSMIKYIPYTITTGFTAGIAVSIFAGQIKDFLGLEMGAVPSEFVEKMIAYAENIGSINWIALAMGVLSIVLIALTPKITTKIPGSLVAIVVTTLIVKLADLDVSTIGSVYGELSSKFPTPALPKVSWKMVQSLISPAFTIAILAAIESLLSCVVSDGMIDSKHNSNAELVAQGVGNIFSGLFGGIPATGAIARTAANVKNGGRTPVAGMVHAITLLLVLLVCMPLAAMIPMTTLAAVLMVVAYNMCEYKQFIHLLKTAPKMDITVLLTSFFLTVFFDLVVAIEIGVVLSALFFMKRMSDTATVRSWVYASDFHDEGRETHDLRYVPENTLVFEVEGPMFFAAADKFLDIPKIAEYRNKNVVIVRMRSVPAIDASAMRNLVKMEERLEKKGIHLILSHVLEQPMRVLKKEAGLLEKIGDDNVCAHIDIALERAETYRNEWKKAE